MTSAPANIRRTVDVIVAGSGHNGLVAAAYLAKSGLEVLVLEAYATPGGMTCTNPMAPEAPDYLINEASIQPSLFRTTTIDRDLGLSSRYGLRQQVIDPAHVQLNHDGSSLALWRDPRRTADELRHFSKRDAEAYLDLFRVINAAVDIGLPMMQTHPTRPALRNVLQAAKAVVSGRRELSAIANWATSSHAEALDEYFESDVIKAALLIGLPFMPFNADLSGWALIYLGVLSKYGVAMFEGGTGSFPKALIACIEEHGGQVRCSAPVQEMVVNRGRVTGVRLKDSGEEIYARRGVMTAFSPATVLRHMIPRGLLSPVLQNRVDHIPTKGRGISDYKLNIALKGNLTLPAHDKWRGDGLDLRIPINSYHSYEQTLAAAQACVTGEVPANVPGLANSPSVFEPSMAPKGCATFWFWSGLTPADPKVGWDKARDQITETVIADTAHYYQGLDELEVARRPLAQPDIAERFFAIDGNVYHVDPIITRFGPRRPAPGLAGYRTPIPGLFLSGSGTHPIAGIFGQPGQNAAQAMIKHLKKEDKAGRRGWEFDERRAVEQLMSEPVDSVIGTHGTQRKVQ
ncbi:NAD(P)/FAD-dependent oxidoreductase [Mycobacterium sp. E1747]|uniref:phytoene desaturase family protein n=1 Tax=Mycobacterium sp. E1747 TaxID=1834128 RepID=UPI0008005FC7|nr:NAD(P)/FAD-dependent oxidoreductase [Mycobacterium sp. E1747]OBH10560.1 dehydrogenase [Mycobacterium sp. E1747]